MLAHTDVPLKRTAVIINDFGSVNVDAALLARRQLELRSITGGCVAAELRGPRRASGNTGGQSRFRSRLDRDVWSGDPEEVLDHLSAPELHDRTVIRRMILVVDGSDFPCSWRGRAVQEEQVRYADLILLNKTDRLDETARQRVEINLRQINSSARIVTTRHGQIEPGLLSETGTSAAALHAHTHEHHHEEREHGHQHDHDHHSHDHHADDDLPHAASTLFLPLAAPVERAASNVSSARCRRRFSGRRASFASPILPDNSTPSSRFATSPNCFFCLWKTAGISPPGSS